MTADNRASADLATTPDDYGTSYYNDAHLGGYGDYGWESDHWRNFFTGVAQRIVGLVEPHTALDVGCAKGMLVQALASLGVDARGNDISDFAIESAHPDVRSRLTVVSATEPIEGRYDVITCVEVLEHMSPSDAQLAIDSMCAATDRILFSSTPADFQESTHVNVHPTAQWAAWFAERGFYRRTDADTSFLTPWAILLERDDPSKRTLVERYEAKLSPMAIEVSEKRQALLEASRRVAELQDEQGARTVHVDDDALLAKHSELTAIDHVLGMEATVARLQYDLKTARSRVRRLRTRLEQREAELTSMRSSRTWRVGRMFTRPLGRLKG